MMSENEPHELPELTPPKSLAVMHLLVAARTRGMTIKELREALPELGHHGAASSRLSKMHHDGYLAMLDEVRDRCHVYVLPQFIGGRVTTEGRRKVSPNAPAPIVRTVFVPQPVPQEVTVSGYSEAEMGQAQLDGLMAAVAMLNSAIQRNARVRPEYLVGNLNTMVDALRRPQNYADAPSIRDSWTKALKFARAQR